jgi:hypothetical protein
MSRYQPALLGGLFIGVLSSLPVLGSANACCCLWVVIGGVLTVYLQQQNRTVDVESSEAALGGLIAGAIGAVINVAVMSFLLQGASASVMFEQNFRATLDRNDQIPPEVRDRLLTMFSSRAFPLLIAAVTVPAYAVFGMLGALLGRAVLRKKTPPPAQIG